MGCELFGIRISMSAGHRWWLLNVLLWSTATLAGPSPSLAASLTLSTSAPPGDALHVEPQSISHPVTIGISNSVSTDPPSEYLTGWQLRLMIEPSPGASGSVEFASAALPAAYVFDGTTGFGLMANNSGDKLTALDFNFPYSGGVQVPDGAGTNLLSVTFSASSDAYGAFGVFAVGGVGNSQWTDALEPVQATRPFVNIPANGSPIQIGALVVGIPGDYNADGIADAADYVVWRKNLGSLTLLPNDDTVGVGADDFTRWRSYFGQSIAGAPLATGHGATASALDAVPEPNSVSTLAIAALGTLAASGWRRKYRQTKRNRSR